MGNVLFIAVEHVRNLYTTVSGSHALAVYISGHLYEFPIRGRTLRLLVYLRQKYTVQRRQELQDVAVR